MLDRKRAAGLLHDTADLIDGIKAKEYGEPQLSFETIAKYWSTYFGITFTVHDVVNMMILLKVARNKRLKKDNYVDICGYASLGGSDDEIGGPGMAPDGEGSENLGQTRRSTKVDRR